MDFISSVEIVKHLTAKLTQNLSKGETDDDLLNRSCLLSIISLADLMAPTADPVRRAEVYAAHSAEATRFDGEEHQRVLLQHQRAVLHKEREARDSRPHLRQQELRVRPQRDQGVRQRARHGFRPTFNHCSLLHRAQVRQGSR